jgi:ComF family protein
MMHLTKIKNLLLDFLFPVTCIGCKQFGVQCCAECLQKIPLSHQNTEKIIAATDFKEDSTLAELIHRFKYDGAKEIGEILVNLFPKNLELPNEKVFVPVPLHKRRSNTRGFNQSAVLADLLAKKFGGEMQNILQRHRYTPPQAQLSREKRLLNVNGAFSMRNHEQKLYTESTYLLIDDVCTTGSTLSECEKVLKENGVQKIVWLVIARA